MQRKRKAPFLGEHVLRELVKGGVNVQRIETRDVKSAFVGNRLSTLQLYYPGTFRLDGKTIKK